MYLIVKERIKYTRSNAILHATTSAIYRRVAELCLLIQHTHDSMDLYFSTVPLSIMLQSRRR